MVSWSALGRSVGIRIINNYPKNPLVLQNAKFTTTKSLGGDHKTMVIQPSRFQYQKFKDMFHYYLMVGLIPVSAIIFYANVFVGPAELRPIPKDYEPKYWEYYRHPITRFIARYIHHNPQQEYEKFMHWVDEEAQLIKLRKLEKEIKAKMAERHDYQAYYYRPLVNKYLRIERKDGDDMMDRLGDDVSE